MSEQTLWSGTSSHWKNIKSYVLFFISIPISVGLNLWKPETIGWWIYVLVAVTGLIAFWNWLVNYTTHYQLTDERLVTTQGILTKVTNTLELYRVRDLQVIQPLFLRVVSLQNIHVITSDATSAEVILDYMPVSANLGDQLRKSVEACRSKKGVRALDMVGENQEDHADGHPMA